MFSGASRHVQVSKGPRSGPGPAKAHAVPVIVRRGRPASAVSNLRRYIATGADMVPLGGGAGYRGGPTASASLRGRKEMVGGAGTQLHFDHDVQSGCVENATAEVSLTENYWLVAPAHGIGTPLQSGRTDCRIARRIRTPKVLNVDCQPYLARPKTQRRRENGGQGQRTSVSNTIPGPAVGWIARAACGTGPRKKRLEVTPLLKERESDRSTDQQSKTLVSRKESQYSSSRPAKRHEKLSEIFFVVRLAQSFEFAN